MQAVAAILAFLLSGDSILGATGATGATGPPTRPQAATAGETSAWHVDAAVALLGEAWDRNESSEWLSGAVAGLDRRVWRGVAVRGEGLVLRVAQAGEDAWLRGFTVGTRMRWGGGRVRRLVDVAVGMSSATARTPPRGTTFNYLAVVGGGVEIPVRRVVITATGRWLHVSNSGREGRGRNPDIQSLGAVVGVGWEWPKN